MICSKQFWHEDLKSQLAKPVAMRDPNPGCNCAINIFVPGKNIKASIRIALDSQRFLHFEGRMLVFTSFTTSHSRMWLF